MEALNITVELVLDNPDSHYAPGRPVKGFVRIRSESEYRFQSLDLSCVWTEPATKEEVGRQDGKILRGGTIAAGQDRRVPFQINLPAQASGEYLFDDLEWYIETELRFEDYENIVVRKQIQVTKGGKKRPTASEQKTTEGKGKGNNNKQKARKAPATPSEIIIAYIYSLIFVAFMFGGSILVFNGVPGKVLPDFVPPFGVACILGGLFVFQKLVEGVTPQVGRVLVLLLCGAGALMGLLTSAFSPSFSILEGELAEKPPLWMHFGGNLGAIAWVTSIVLATWAGAILGRKGKADLASLTGMIMLSVTGLSLTAGFFGGSHKGPEERPEAVYLIGLLSVVCIGVLMWSKGWRRPPVILAVVSAVPSVLLAIFFATRGNDEGLIFGGTTAGLLALYFFFVLRSHAAEAWLGKVEPRFEPGLIHPGGEFKMIIPLIPRRDVTINKITATLDCMQVYRQLGSNDAGDSEHIRVSRQVLAGKFPVQLKAGQARDLVLNTVLALDAPVSSTGSNRHYWQLHLHIDLEGAPDWEDDYEIKVEHAGH